MMQDPALLLPLTILVELLGGLSVLVGYKTRSAAIVLFLFLIPTTLVFHTNFAQRMQVVQFMKNLAIMGGLLQLAGTEPGALSLDRKLGSVKDPTL